MTRILIAAAVSLMAAAPAFAQGMTAQDFVTKAASANMFEIQSSQMALEQSQDAAIQTFAQQMIADHTPVGQKMTSLAENAGLTVPQQPQGEAADLLNDVKQAKGDNFDDVYVQDQIKGHKSTIKLFQTYAQSGDNDALTAFAEQTLPALMQHLDLAQSLEAR